MSRETPGQTVRRLREARPGSPSRETVARAVGVSNGAVNQWEADVIVPRRGNATKLDEYLEAGGAVLTAFGYVSQPADELAALKVRVALLEAAVETLQEISTARAASDPDWLRAPSADGH